MQTEPPSGGRNTEYRRFRAQRAHDLNLVIEKSNQIIAKVNDSDAIYHIVDQFGGNPQLHRL